MELVKNQIVSLLTMLMVLEKDATALKKDELGIQILTGLIMMIDAVIMTGMTTTMTIGIMINEVDMMNTQDITGRI